MTISELKQSVQAALDERMGNEEAALYLGISPNTLNTWRCIKKPFIRYSKIGRFIYYKKSDLDAFIAERTVEA